ncbi:MAG: nuclear transport factor 2 family protein [Pseudomonadota bacterium]|jgi:hypothetical protein|nr:MAG: hypothetical protein DIU56_07430 [Pseudomonadota bacterium]
MSGTTDLLAEYECYRLVVAFADAVDMQEYDRLRDLLTDDAVFARPTDPDNAIRGADAIVQAFHMRPRNRLSVHMCTNVQIRLTGRDTAEGKCYVLLYSADAAEPVMPGKGRKAMSSQLVGIYEDRFRRTEAGWRFSERRGRLLFHT